MIKRSVLFSFVAVIGLNSCLNKEQKEGLKAIKEMSKEIEEHEEVAKSTEENGSFSIEIDGKQYDSSGFNATLMASEDTKRILMLEASSEEGDMHIQIHFKVATLKEGTYEAGNYMKRAAAGEEIEKKEVLCTALFDDAMAEEGSVTISDLDLKGNPNTISGKYEFSVQESNGKIKVLKGEFKEIGIYKAMGATME
ncbi:DUF6252 family protein [Sinomicrobium weinanense]|uniref:Uncharacterized protein n=1 Tax=Sinomicrobium weinanense TaxID=2842200 RepID=A0A926JN50_9FLAO|nr:DUF6252 family protein [Sinomicrobium weinanense]MBC9794342.1 hypothetical protein [Sinomicrobium weinanense]MBU3124249.1 hypothetical protein [Sinomicrobium weinanense]